MQQRGGAREVGLEMVLLRAAVKKKKDKQLAFPTLAV